MPLVRRSSSGQSASTKIVKKPAKVTAKVLTTRPAQTITELGDTDFGDLDSSKDGMVVSYDSKTDTFVLITADDVLIESAADEDIPDEFVDQVEEEVDLGTIALDELDGGSFT